MDRDYPKGKDIKIKYIRKGSLYKIGLVVSVSFKITSSKVLYQIYVERLCKGLHLQKKIKKSVLLQRNARVNPIRIGDIGSGVHSPVLM